MTAFTTAQREEFYNGFVETLLWSTGGEPDYSEAPANYDVYQSRFAATTWQVRDPEGRRVEDCASTKRAAIAAAWEDSGEEAPQLESLEDFDLAPDTAETLRAVCRTFMQLNVAELAQYARRRFDGSGHGPAGSSVWAHAGHDFWLTLAGAGVGFWECGLDDLGDRLIAACKPFAHNLEPYVGDDGLIHV